MLLRGDVVTNYIVKLGDDIDTIAKSFGISSSEIIKDNDLSSDKLFIGQSLKINNTNIKSYITRKFDTISSISSKFSNKFLSFISVASFWVLSIFIFLIFLPNMAYITIPMPGNNINIIAR